jgi:hypothetical protein
MKRTSIFTILLTATALMSGRYACAGQPPFAASDPDKPAGRDPGIAFGASGGTSDALFPAEVRFFPS